MESLLEQLYYGDIAPGLERTTPAYEELRCKLMEQEQIILGILGKKNKKLLNDYQEIEDDILSLEQVLSFSQGFRIGAQLILAIKE